MFLGFNLIPNNWYQKIEYETLSKSNTIDQNSYQKYIGRIWVAERNATWIKFKPYQGAICKPIWVCIFLGKGKILVFWKYSSMYILHTFFLHHGEIITKTKNNLYEQYNYQYLWIIWFDGIKWYINMYIYTYFG